LASGLANKSFIRSPNPDPGRKERTDGELDEAGVELGRPASEWWIQNADPEERVEEPFSFLVGLPAYYGAGVISPTFQRRRAIW
jgi:hypothetical protein